MQYSGSLYQICYIHRGMMGGGAASLICVLAYGWLVVQ
jgi:hypothetical protein